MRTNVKLGVLLFVMAACFGASYSRNGITAETILDLANQDRARFGLPALAINPTLSLAAHAKAEDMMSKGYFNHVAPDGTNPWHFFRALGYNYSYAGENLAINYRDPEELESSWMSSPSHRDNILSPNFSETGLAIVTDEGRVLVVQFFGSRGDVLTYDSGLSLSN